MCVLRAGCGITSCASVVTDCTQHREIISLSITQAVLPQLALFMLKRKKSSHFKIKWSFQLNNHTASVTALLIVEYSWSLEHVVYRNAT